MSLSLSDWLKDSTIKPTQEKSSPCETKKGDCLKVIQFILDGEASQEQQEHFDKHIVDCIPCFEQFNLDKSIKLAIQTKVAQMKVPSDLVSEIKSRINGIA